MTGEDASFFAAAPPARHEQLTFKANRRRGRHGWLRLTPAYSVRVVEDLLSHCGPQDVVLDPFCGTGTTALACAQAGISAHTVDVNPFLVWFANAKCMAYSSGDVAAARSTLVHALATRDGEGAIAWIPPIRAIDKWWEPEILMRLARIFASIESAEITSTARDLLHIIFCRAAIAVARVSFGHQSMSFAKAGRPQVCSLPSPEKRVVAAFAEAESAVLPFAEDPVQAACGRAFLGDARSLPEVVPRADYTRVITSPPYPNRMSYVRELRPYMYWLGYLTSGRQAGELDWRAIGGTWGCATSRLMTWSPNPEDRMPHAGLDLAIERIGQRSPILSRYVAKYFRDVVQHIRSLQEVLAPHARLYYIVGNSRFYDVLLPTQDIYAAIFEQQGFHEVRIDILRKRTSKRELFEYLVSARR